MNRIDQCFAELRQQDKKAIIPFLTAGYPTLKETEQLIITLFENGADMIKLGVPFSDPIAESPEIQSESIASLEAGTTIDGIFDMVSRVRTVTEKPIVLMMYLNTIFVYGTEKFFTLCEKNGIDGVIVPDMPYEEREELLPFAKKFDIYSMNMVSPVSKDRIREIAAHSKGFLSCVSGSRFPEDGSAAAKALDDFFSLVRENSACPYCIGTDLTDLEDIKTAASFCNGIVLNEAIVTILSKEKENAQAAAGAFIKELSEKLRGMSFVPLA